MFVDNCEFVGPRTLEIDVLHILKFIPYFEERVREEALQQRIPIKILRVLKPCRVCLVITEDAFFCVAAYYGPNDPQVRDVFAENRRSKATS